MGRGEGRKGTPYERLATGFELRELMLCEERFASLGGTAAVS